MAADFHRRFKIAGLVCAVVLVVGVLLAVAYPRVVGGDNHWTLWQIPPVGKFQAMSYVIRTSRGQLVVVDGGWEDDGPPLTEFINAHGGRVAAWFLTHPHPDHVGAITAILRMPSHPPIDAIYASLPNEEFVRGHEPMYVLDLLKLESVIEAAKLKIHDVSPGETIRIDGLAFEILGVRNPEVHVNALNNSSMAFRVVGAKSILFPGDLGVEGGRKLLAGPYAEKVRADYVQMAHHGQTGVDEAFYKAVAPTCCLWPTPRWLWENDSGSGPDSGPWKTLETRRWIKDLGVTRNVVSMDGVAEISE